jgi:hypothetical protein
MPHQTEDEKMQRLRSNGVLISQLSSQLAAGAMSEIHLSPSAQADQRIKD